MRAHEVLSCVRQTDPSHSGFHSVWSNISDVVAYSLTHCNTLQSGSTLGLCCFVPLRVKFLFQGSKVSSCSKKANFQSIRKCKKFLTRRNYALLPVPRYDTMCTRCLLNSTLQTTDLVEFTSKERRNIYIKLKLSEWLSLTNTCRYFTTDYLMNLYNLRNYTESIVLTER